MSHQMKAYQYLEMIVPENRELNDADYSIVCAMLHREEEKRYQDDVVYEIGEADADGEFTKLITDWMVEGNIDKKNKAAYRLADIMASYVVRCYKKRADSEYEIAIESRRTDLSENVKARLARCVNSVNFLVNDEAYAQDLVAAGV